VREWILGCPTHEDYLAKLGYERIGFLGSKVMKDMWKYDLASLMPSISTSPEYNPTVISTLGVFEKMDGEELILTGYFPDTNMLPSGLHPRELWLGHESLAKGSRNPCSLSG